MEPSFPAINTIVNCQWCENPSLRQMARATRQDGKWQITAPEPVGDPMTLVGRLRKPLGDQARLLLGLAFPIGVPLAYARSAGISSFREWDLGLGDGDWRNFFTTSEQPSRCDVYRPICSGRPTERTFAQLLRRLGMTAWYEAWRTCDPLYGRESAQRSLFWPNAPHSVGRAVKSGWRDLLIPVLTQHAAEIGLWPFDGRLTPLLESHRTIIAETFAPAVQARLGVYEHFRGNTQRQRLGPRNALRAWAERRQVTFDEPLLKLIDDGFGELPAAREAMLAVIGLCAAVDAVEDHHPEGSPPTKEIGEIEGWILGHRKWKRPKRCQRTALDEIVHLAPERCHTTSVRGQ